MEIAIAHPYDYSLPLDETLEAIAEGRFELISFGADREHSRYHAPDGRQALRDLLSTFGLRVHNIHVPIEAEPHISSPDEDTRKAGVDKALTAIKACVYFNSGMIVLHLAHHAGEDEYGLRLESVRRSLDEILQAAERAGVKIACENVFNTSANMILKAILDEFKQANIGLCYDSSHANLMDDPTEFLREYAGRLFVTHLSDNRGKDDDHLLPGMGTIDWPGIMGAIKETGYQGPILLEVVRASSGYNHKPPAAFTKQAYNQAKWLLEMMR